MSTLSSNGPIRAAQYLRMSSDNQRYSTENQQNAIAEYAQQHGYNVTTRRMQGRTLKNPEPLWTRFLAFDPIVPVTEFQRAQERLAQAADPAWTKETIIDSLRSLLAHKGRLTQALIDAAEDVPSSPTVVAHFGSISAAYDAIGYEPLDRRHFGMNAVHWSKRSVLTGLQKLHSAKGYITNRLIDSFPDLPAQDHVRRLFGSIHNAKREAGLPVLSHGEAQRLSWERRNATACDEHYLGGRWTDAKLLQTLHQIEKQYGYISLNLLDQNRATPGKSYLIKRFGTLANARALAGLPARSRSQIMLAALQRKREDKTIGRTPRPPGQRSRLRYRSEDILFGLRRLAKREGAISACLIDQDSELPSWGTVVNYFGSLSAAYRLAGLIRLDGKPVRFGLPPRK
jgi:Resolvase, N terminal domain